MAIHKPWDRPFYLLGGSVMKNGFSLNLAEGQFGIFNVSKQTPKGAVAVESFKGYGKDNLFELRLGNRQKLTRSTSNKMYSSFPFHINDVVDLHVSAPKRTEMKVDELIIGYNGIDPKTSIQLMPGEHKEINIELEGKALEFLGVPEGIANIIVPLDANVDFASCGPETDPCAPVDMLPIMNYAVQYLKDYEFRGGVKLTDYVEVTPVIELASIKRVGELVQVKYCMTVCDTGDQGALALVQQGVPDATVTVKERVGAMTTYEVTLTQKPGGAIPSAPEAYKRTLPSLIKGCANCPSGYDKVEGGFVYAVLLEDEGTDKSSAVEALANAVAGTALKGEGQKFGVGMYTVVLTKKLTDAALATFITANPTATVDFAGEVSAIYNNDSTVTVSWTECGRCTFTTEPYKIVLPDTECGESRLTELQAAYPTLNITLAQSSTSTRTITLTGASGTANISIGGVNYLATFATNLATTANNFVNSHAAAIFAATGATVNAFGSTIVVTDATVGFPAITVTNATSNLAGTVSAIAPIPVTGGCQREYQTATVTNVVCEQCDPIYQDTFSSEAPGPFDGVSWKKEEVSVDGTSGKYGIRLKGKVFKLATGEALRDMIGYVEDSIKIRATGGYITDFNWSTTGGNIKDTPFNVSYLSRWEPRTHVAGNLLDDEVRAKTYFTGRMFNHDYMGRILTGNESNLVDLNAQYVDYGITLRRNIYSQGLSQRLEENITYHIMVEVGRHADVEEVLNALAAVNGIEGVKAFPTVPVVVGP